MFEKTVKRILTKKTVLDPETQRWSYMTAMICIDCERVWETSRISKPCPRCGSHETVALSRWTMHQHARPTLIVMEGGLA
jgi:Zn finger protein HypA/HybF involved in hydrogenase expression